MLNWLLLLAVVTWLWLTRYSGGLGAEAWDTDIATLRAPLSRYIAAICRIGPTERSIEELLDVAGYRGGEIIPTGPQGFHGWCRRRISRFTHRWACWLSERTPPRILGKGLLLRTWKGEPT